MKRLPKNQNLKPNLKEKIIKKLPQIGRAHVWVKPSKKVRLPYCFNYYTPRGLQYLAQHQNRSNRSGMIQIPILWFFFFRGKLVPVYPCTTDSLTSIHCSCIYYYVHHSFQ